MPRYRSTLLVTVLAVAAACNSTPSLPPVGESGVGGLVAFDPAAPASTQVWQRPEWHQGDRFVLVRGGKQRIEFEVATVTDDDYTLLDDKGNRFKRGRDLSNIGEWPKDGDEPLHVLTPPDVRFHWPLWVGKRWRCQYEDRTAGTAKALPLEVGYEVEDLDTVVTPAGTFAALHIVRTSRLRIDGGFADRVNVIWYAPDPGIEVRQVIGDTSVELYEWRSAAKSKPAKADASAIKN